jgi:hypothetical protein
MTKEQAIALAETKFWEGMTDRQDELFKGKRAPTSVEILNLIPEDKRIIILT